MLASLVVSFSNPFAVLFSSSLYNSIIYSVAILLINTISLLIAVALSLVPFIICNPSNLPLPTKLTLAVLPSKVILQLL